MACPNRRRITQSRILPTPSPRRLATIHPAVALAAASAGVVFASLRSANAQAETRRSAPIYAAIERHKAAWGAYQAVGGDPRNEDAFNEAVSAADDIRYDLAATPCANDTELLGRLRYLHAYEKRLIRGRPFEIDCHGSVSVAPDVHFNPEA